MRRMFLALGLALFLVGCTPRLRHEASFEVPQGGYELTMSEVSKQQNVKITGTATGGPVDVFVIYAKDKAQAEKDILAKKFTSPVIIDKQLNTTDIKMEPIIPAQNEWMVKVYPATLKKANVQIKINN